MKYMNAGNREYLINEFRKNNRLTFHGVVYGEVTCNSVMIGKAMF